MKGLVLLLLVLPAFAQQAWPPPLPAFEFKRPSVRPTAGEALDDKVLSPGLALLAKYDVAGLGAEAGDASRWSAGRASVRLVESGGGWALTDASGAARAVTPAFGAALRNMNRYFALTGPTLADPIGHAELEAAFLTPAAVSAVRTIFDRSFAERVTVGGKMFFPELGGEATLDAGLSFHFNDDPARPALRELIARRGDPAALARLFSEQPENMALLDAQGILKHHLEVRARWDAEGRVPPERRDAMLGMVVDTVAESAAAHYSGNFATQLKTMIRDDWSGRYAGTWHCHPPDFSPAGWVDDYPPSEADYDAAAKTGQEIVVTFLKDGFDVYDLSQAAGGSLFERAAAFSYRSAEWRAHFDGVFSALSREAAAP